MGERVIYDNQIAFREASERGITAPANAVYNIAYAAIQVLVFYAVAGLILWRTADGFRWFTATVLMLFPTNNMSVFIGVAPPFPGALLLIEIPAYTIFPLWLAWLAFFPNGRLAPRWAVVPICLTVALFGALQVANILAVMGFLPPQIDSYSASLGGYGALFMFGLVLISQIHRYRRVFTGRERQQVKWFLFGLSLFIAGLLAFLLVPRAARGHSLIQDLFSLSFLSFPIIVAVAILRYRLWDIDILIRKTLQYTLLTALLALVYFGSVVLLQSIFRSVSGGQSPAVIVISTLLIAALFTPLRHRVQSVIDRRFFRRKYDAQKGRNPVFTVRTGWLRFGGICTHFEAFCTRFAS